MTADRQDKQRPLLDQRRARLIAMAVGIILSVLLLDLVLITHNKDQLQEQFRQSAKANERLLADIANSYIDRGDTTGLITHLQSSVFGDLLYEQVVVDGQVLAERLAPKVGRSTLPVEPLPPDVVDRTTVRKLSSGESYLDVRLGLTPLAIDRNGQVAKSNPPTTYLRLGYSMISIDLEVGRYSLFIIGASGLLLIAIGLLFWLTTLVFRVMSPHKPAETGGHEARVPPEISAGMVPRTNGDGDGTGVTVATGRKLQLRGGELMVDEGRKLIACDGQQIALSPKEYKLFMQLASDPARTFSDEEIIQEVWGTESFATSKDVKQYIYFLRRKLGDKSEASKFIETVRGHGYKLAV